MVRSNCWLDDGRVVGVVDVGAVTIAPEVVR
jgi:hypothetical protein